MAAAEARSDDPADQIIESVRGFEQAADAMALTQPGCLFVSFVWGQVPDTDGVRPLIIAAIALRRPRIAEKLVLARAAGRLAEDVDIDSLADHVFTTFEGAFILARATRDATHVWAQLCHLGRLPRAAPRGGPVVTDAIGQRISARTPRAARAKKTNTPTPAQMPYFW